MLLPRPQPRQVKPAGQLPPPAGAAATAVLPAAHCRHCCCRSPDAAQCAGCAAVLPLLWGPLPPLECNHPLENQHALYKLGSSQYSPHTLPNQHCCSTNMTPGAKGATGTLTRSTSPTPTTRCALRPPFPPTHPRMYSLILTHLPHPPPTQPQALTLWVGSDLLKLAKHGKPSGQKTKPPTPPQATPAHPRRSPSRCEVACSNSSTIGEPPPNPTVPEEP